MFTEENLLHIILTLTLAILQAGTILHILVSKHSNPAQASFWLVLVSLLPGAGLIFYLLFGITRFEHVRTLISSLRSQLINGNDPQLSRLAQLNRALEKFQLSEERSRLKRMIMLDRLFPENPALEGNSPELLQDGVAVYPRMLADIKNARKCIRMQSFILNSDEVGQAFMDALSERAAAGVDVKVLFDSVGSCKSYFSWYFRKLLRRRKDNFSFQPFSRVNILAPWKFQLRNHRKLLLVDGRIAYIGGVNISAENERLKRVPPSRYIHDLHCRITGPAVAYFNLSFWTDYFYTNRRKVSKITLCSGDTELPLRTGNTAVRVIPGGPGNEREGTRKLFFAAAALAEKELWILTPYFVPGKDYVDALCMASARGVDVRIVVPLKNNHFWVDCAARNFYDQLIDAGVTIYEKLGYFSHSKALLVDSEWGFMGSSNCDSRSFYLNFELDFCFEGGTFTADMVRQFHEEFAGARKLTAFRQAHTPRWRRMINSIAGLFTPVL